MATLIQRDLAKHGMRAQRPVHWNLSPALLIEEAIRRGEGTLSADGAFVGITKPHTGRSPDDKFVVREPSSENNIWWGKVNAAMQPTHYDALLATVREHLTAQELFVQDLHAGADPDYRLNVRLVTPKDRKSTRLNSSH